MDNDAEDYMGHVFMKSCENMSIPLRCISIGSPPDGIVLDPFMGSGTTAEAAEELGRPWLGYELNPEYCKIIEQRLIKSRSKRNLLINAV